MSKTTTVLFLLAAIALTKGNIEEAVDSFFDDRCSNGGQDYALRELMPAIENLKSCVKKPFPADANETHIFKMICTKESGTIYKCVQEFMHKMEPCLLPEERYFTDYVLYSFNSTLELYCKDNGKLIYEQRNNLKNANCSLTFSAMGPIFLTKCLPKFKVLESLTNTNFVFKEEYLCSDMESMKNCFLDMFEENCENDTYTQYIETVYNPSLKWCVERKKMPNEKRN